MTGKPEQEQQAGGWDLAKDFRLSMLFGDFLIKYGLDRNEDGDEDGMFECEELDDGSYMLRVEAPGGYGKSIHITAAQAEEPYGVEERFAHAASMHGFTPNRLAPANPDAPWNREDAETASRYLNARAARVRRDIAAATGRERIQQFIDKHRLDYGNGEITYDDDGDGFDVTIEAPNHTTTSFTVSREALSRPGALEHACAEACYAFDADEEFNELWSPEFAEHNGFTPSRFITMLQNDEEFFHDVWRDCMKVWCDYMKPCKTARYATRSGMTERNA